MIGKKVLVKVVLLLFLLSTAVFLWAGNMMVFASSAYYVNDTFDYADGYVPTGADGYSIDQGGGDPQYTFVKVVNGALRIAAEGNGKNPSILKNIPNGAAGKVVVQYKLHFADDPGLQLNNSTYVFPMFSNSDYWTDAAKGSLAGGQFKTMYGTSGTEAYTQNVRPALGKSYTVKYVFDYDNQKFDVSYTDIASSQVESFTNLAFRRQVDSLNQIIFWGNSSDSATNHAAVDIDDLQVYDASFKVTGTTIANNAADVPVNTDISFDFSDAVDTSTLSNITVVNNANNQPVSHNITTSNSNKKCTITFQAALANNTTYKVTIPTTVVSTGGVALNSAYVTMFKTVPAAGDREYIVNDTFDYTDGYIPTAAEGYDIAQGGGNAAYTYVKVKDGALRIASEGDGKNPSVVKNIPAGVSGKFVVQYKLHFADDAGLVLNDFAYVFPMLSYNDYWTDATKGSLNGGRFKSQYLGGSEVYTQSVYPQLGKTYSIKYLLNYDTKKFDVTYTDIATGQAESFTNIDFKNPAAGLYQIIFWGGSADAGTQKHTAIDLDDLQIYRLPKDFSIVDSQFTNLAGKTVTSLIPSSVINAKVGYKNNTDAALKLPMIIALYDGSNNIKSISSVIKSVDPGSTVYFTGGFKLPDNATDYYIKAFVWDSFALKNMNSNSVTFPAAP